jgi:hypothetical protein
VSALERHFLKVGTAISSSFATIIDLKRAGEVHALDFENDVVDLTILLFETEVVEATMELGSL